MNWCLPFVSSGPSASVAAPPDLEREEDNVRTVSTIMSLACCCHGAQQKSVTMQNDCMYGQGGKGKASFYNYVTRSLVSLSKSTARGLTKDTLR